MPPAPSGTAPIAGVSDTPVKIGTPYEVGGKEYVPADTMDYDEVGYASWYGDEFANKPTANGENYVPAGISAAHKTLPLPSYAEVTALETGRTILVRINDRGPFAKDRIIDLSRGAADQLGITDQGVAGVRVRRVFPPETDRALLRSGRSAYARPVTSDGLLNVLRKKLGLMPKPVAPVQQTAAAETPPAAAPVTRAKPANNGRFIVEGEGASPVTNPKPQYWSGPARTTLPTGFMVQVAAFGSKARADALASKLGAKVYASSDSNIWRVRYGPYSSATDAQSGLQRARQNGYSDAKVIRADR
ncbi:septal ring lytic transglycosylase RlpA family protein [Alterisphingorhabdus coralli]|uniref:Endolytic peptidoglycan transglycosylase RlpA n=1 Tax=Alterisphingorhabdus coralli TaxID=3071408 RepID=A0AA97F4S6_9SPHN|nr:septal ring lytic transglycosylase RlpA family protein [Parasphingorhabdus sp. SCSIO 66989]WOE74023.1 septal ring lytic transglycosylase RlpA family protein [Parasphingorhabdus sp. SCSIO 66989]